MKNEYHGWSNRATWNVSLWLNNDESLYCSMVSLLEAYRDDEIAGAALKRLCKTLWGESTPDDCLLDEADFTEIARDNRA